MLASPRRNNISGTCLLQWVGDLSHARGSCPVEPGTPVESLLVFPPHLREDFRKGNPPPETNPVNESVVVQPDRVPDRLTELGLTEAIVHQALNIAHSFAARCT